MTTAWQEGFGNKPESAGWYAIHYCWDGSEGSFCGAEFFDGKAWKKSLPISNFAGPFASHEEADAFAIENDISF